MPTILLVDDEYSFRLMVSDFLKIWYEVISVESSDQALQTLAAHNVDLVIADMCMPGMSGLELLSVIRQRYPAVKTALMTANDVDQIIRMAKEDGISNIIAKTAPFNFDELLSVIKGLLTGEIFGLVKYLLPEGTILGHYRITSSKEGREVREAVVHLMKERFGTPGDMRLSVDELITNAVYHAHAAETGFDKSRSYTEVTLDPDDCVFVDCGFDNEKCGVSIADCKGRLRKEIVLGKMDRHISGEGLCDCSGRGIHLSRTCVDRMIINIKREEKTEIILLNYLKPVYQGFKSLYVNEL